jgi:hypothetical protein
LDQVLERAVQGSREFRAKMLELAKGEQAHRQAVQKRANRLDWAALQQDEHEDDSQLRDLGLDLESLWNGSSIICLERNACAATELVGNAGAGNRIGVSGGRTITLK